MNKVNTPVSDPRPSCWVNYHQVGLTSLNHTHSNRKEHGWNQESILCHDVMPSVHQYLIEKQVFLDQLLFSQAKLVSLTNGLKIITGLGDYRLFLYPHYGKLGRTSSSCSSDRKKDFYNLFLGSEYFAQRFNRPFGENSQTNLVGCFFGHPGHIFGQILGL